ncbi:MAG: multiheme c-type cytochrome, partial [Desulfatiglandales bacterium]
MKRPFALFLTALVSLLFVVTTASSAKQEVCIRCHRAVTRLLVKDWQSSKHSENDVTCSVCHGSEHKAKKTAHLAKMPTEATCAECHEEQFDQFSKGKHNLGWTSMNALPVTHMEPDELIEGGKGCGGCHNMGIKSEHQRKELREKGYTYRTNSCDECHTRHTFS